MTYIAIIVLAALCCAWALRRVLVADRARWARREENRRLYDAVAGKVLVPGLAGFDIYPANPGIIPEDTILIVPADVFHGLSLIDGPLYSSQDLGEQWGPGGLMSELRISMAVRYPVIDPKSVFKITGVS